ncbi:dTDP-glucose 4,6-dehydratase, partial [bacterium]|nr:dTDP-glucose 4,6-dehydratase [bacterium]
TILEKGEVGEIYNIGADNHRENIEIARTMLDILGLPTDRIEHVADRLGHDFRYAVDRTKIEALGWRPEIPFEKGFRETVLHFADRFGGEV